MEIGTFEVTLHFSFLSRLTQSFPRLLAHRNSTISENTGQRYFYNTETNDTQWYMPSCVRFYMSPCLRSYFRTREVKEMRAKFKIYDKDGNGKIYLSDVKKCLESMKMVFTEKRLAFLLRSLNVNCEDQISFRYFAAVVFGIRRGRMSLLRVLLAAFGFDNPFVLSTRKNDRRSSSKTRKILPGYDDDDDSKNLNNAIVTLGDDKEEEEEKNREK